MSMLFNMQPVDLPLSIRQPSTIEISKAPLQWLRRLVLERELDCFEVLQFCVVQVLWGWGI
jgi:hypothetical protein